MFQKRIKSLLFPGVLLVLLVCACFLYLNFLVQRPSVQRFLVEKISKAAGYNVEVESFRVSLWRGLTITAQGLSASSSDRNEHISASVARIGFDGKALLRGNIIPKSLDLENPVITFPLRGRTEGKEVSVEETLGKINFLRLAAIRSLSITGGQVKIEGSPFSLQALFLRVSRAQKVPEQVIHLKTAFGFRGRYIPFRLQGQVRYGEDQAKTSVDLVGEALKIPVSWIPWPHFSPFSAGLFDVQFHAAGSPFGDTFSAGGTLRGSDLRFAISHKERRKEYALSSMTVDFRALLDKGTLRISIPQARLLDTSLSAKISFKPAKPSSRLNLSIQSPFMPLNTFKAVFPTSLVPAWMEEGLFPRLSGGEVETKGFSLVGTLDQIDHLSRPQNRSILAMKVAWKNMNVLQHEFPLPFERVAGQMEIKGNVLKISPLAGRFGTSSVKEASLTVSPLIGGSSVYSTTLAGEFAIQDLVKMRQFPWTPKELKEKLAALAGSSGLLSARLKAVRKESGTVPRIENASLEFRECTFIHKALLFPVKVTKGDVQIEETGPVRFRGSGSWGHSALEVSGSADRSLENLATKITGTLDLDTLAARLLPGRTWSLHFGEHAASTMSISRKGTAWFLAGAIDLKERPALKVGSLSLNPLCKKGRIHFDLGYIPGKNLDITSLDGRFGKSSLSVSGEVRLTGEKIITAEVNTPGFFIEDLGGQLQGGCPVAGGVIKGHIRGHLPWNDPLSCTLTGELESRNLCLAVGALAHPLTNGGFKAVFSGDRLGIKSLEFTTGKNTIEIQGHLRGWKTLQGNLTVGSKEIDLGDFFQRKPGRSPKERNSFFGWMLKHGTKLGVSLRASRVIWQEMSMGPFAADGLFEKGAFHLLSSRLKWKHGVITAKGNFGGEDGRKITFLSHVRLFDQPILEILRSFNIQDPYIEGQLSSDVLLSGEGHDKASLVAGLQGNGRVLVEKGVIKKSNILIQILDFLSIQKIFRRPPPNLSKEGFYFDKIGADFEIKKGIIYTENLLMGSPVFNGAAQGILDLPGKQIKGSFGVQPLVTLDSLVSKIPIVGYILTGKDKTLLVYYFKVRGPFSDPKVTYVPLKNWGNSIMGYVTRIFLTPPRLFEKLMHLRKPAEE